MNNHGAQLQIEGLDHMEAVLGKEEDRTKATQPLEMEKKRLEVWEGLGRLQ